MYVNAKEVMQTLGIGRGTAYKIIRQLNEELKAQGFIVIAGKCSRKYFNEKFYGCNASKNQKGMS
jgi:hypothetical protein